MSRRVENGVWNRELIVDVARLYIGLDVADEVIHYGGAEAIDATQHRLGLALCNEAHTFGVELLLRDVRYAQKPSDRPFCQTFRASWWPTVTEVEFTGPTEHDGLITHIPDPWTRYRLPRRANLPAALDDGRYLPGIPIIEYELTGWREAERRWILSPIR